LPALNNQNITISRQTELTKKIIALARGDTLMFSHLKIKKILSSYIDGETNTAECQLIERHLQGCLACKKYLNELRFVSQQLKKWPDQEISNDLEQEIKKKSVATTFKGVANMNTRKVLVGTGSGVLALVLLCALLLPLQNHMKRSAQGRVASSANEIGEQYYASRGPAEGSASAIDGRNYRVNFAAASPSAGYDNALMNGKFGSRLQAAPQAQLFSVVPSESALAFQDNFSVTGNLRLPADGPVYNDSTGPIVIIEPYLPATGTEAKLIRTAQVTLEVTDVQKKYDRVIAISKDKGGYLADARFEEGANGRGNAEIVLRVPRDKFEGTLDAIRELGTVKKFDIKSADMSQEYSRLTSDLNTLKIVYDKIAEKLKEKKTDINNAIRLESELSPVGKQLDEIRSRLASLDNAIAMSTITVTLTHTSWKLIFQDDLNNAKLRLMELASNLINSAVELLPMFLALVALGLTGIAGFVMLARFIKKRRDKKGPPQI
jgi:hypothetical protein